MSQLQQEHQQAESVFLRHEPCPKCQAQGADRSGNNLSRYSDGHGYCHACGYYEGGMGDDGNNDERNNAPDYSSFHGLPVDSVPLTKRGLTQETCAKFGYGISRYKNYPCQVASYRGKDGLSVVAQHVRMPDKEFRWIGDTSSIQLFGQHLWKSGGKRVTVTEGEIDCLTVSQCQDNKWPVVSVPNGAQSAYKYLKQNLEWLESFETVVLCFDMDEAGREAVEKCVPLFSVGKVCIAELPLKDPNECLKAKRQAELISALWNAHPYRPDGIIAGSELWDAVMTPPQVGYDIPYPALNEKLKGLRQGELYLFTAGSGIGKSTLVNEIAYHLKTVHGLPLGVIALEESKARNAMRYLGLYLNKPLHIPEVYEATPKEDLREAFDAVLAKDWYIYDHFGSSNIDVLLSKLRYMAVALGCKVIVLDHISIVVSALGETGGESERKTIDILMTKLRQLIEETNVMVLAVVHLKRPDKGKSYNEGRQVSLTDLRGSGSLEQISDAVIALERDQQGENPDVSQIRVLKNRAYGIVGSAGEVKYDGSTGRLMSCDCGGVFGVCRDEDTEEDQGTGGYF